MRSIIAIACLLLAWGAGLASAYFWPSLLPQKADSGPKLDPQIVSAEDSVRKVLRDPASAYFEDVATHKAGGKNVVCGTVNSKNGMGGYVGNLGFMFDVGANTVVFQPTEVANQDTFAKEWLTYCNDNPASTVKGKTTSTGPFK